jgi:hypothetical protein
MMEKINLQTIARFAKTVRNLSSDKGMIKNKTALKSSLRFYFKLTRPQKMVEITQEKLIPQVFLINALQS